MRIHRHFTLLEIAVSFALLSMIAGAVGWKIYGLLEKRKFHTGLEQLKSRIETVHRLAISMQADWEGILQLKGKNWTFQAFCLDPPRSKSFSPVSLYLGEVCFNEEFRDSYRLFFFSSGGVRPAGTFRFKYHRDGETQTLKLLTLFGKEEGDGVRKLGPTHPDES